VESFKELFIRIFSILTCLSFICSQDNIDKLLIIDYSKVIDREFQFSIGSNMNRISDFSIDKYVSHNLIASTKISTLNPNQFKIISQFSLKFINSSLPLNFLIGYSKFSNKLQSFNWMHFGSVIDIKFNENLFYSFGMYYNDSNKNIITSNTRFFISFGLKLFKRLSSSILFNYNPQTAYINKNIEINIHI
tara:strand:+ start:283 stop:855 length:573 start_codon:yes stop_codon:yes gene_type:complete